MPSVYCQRPGSAFVQMVPSRIWESLVTPEPRSPSLFSSLIPSSFSTPSYLSFIRSLSPLFSFPFMSCCVPLWTSFPSVSYFSPYYHPHVPCLFLCSASLLSSPPTLASVIISSSFRLYGRMSERQNQINLCSWPLAPMTSSVASGDISIQIQLRESAVCHVE